MTTEFIKAKGYRKRRELEQKRNHKESVTLRTGKYPCFLFVVRSRDDVAIQEPNQKGMTQVLERQIMKHARPTN